MDNITPEQKQEAINYLATQGYPDLTWRNILAIYNSFTDDPTGRLENEIDSIFASFDLPITE